MKQTSNIGLGQKRVPGRPRQFEPERVIDDAVTLFWKRGYQPTTTRELENALGISQSSLYNEFGSKSALYESAMTRYESMTEASLIAPLLAAEDKLHGLEVFFSDLLEWITHDGRRGCMLINMMAEDGAASAALSERSKAYRVRVLNVLRTSLQCAAEERVTTQENIDERAQVLLTLLLGMNIAARGGADERELNAMLRAGQHLIRGWRV